MNKVTEKLIINAPLSEVWVAWDDYGNIACFNPNLKGSHLINASQKTGLGATRQCDLIDGKNYIRERIVEYSPERRMAVDIYAGTLPFKKARVDIELSAVGQNRTEVSFTMAFQPKMGILGLLMVPLMKPQLRKSIGKLLNANRAFIEDGELANAA